MNSPKSAYLTAAKAALVTALTAAGYDNASYCVVINPAAGQAFPYVRVAPGTALPWGTKTTEGAEIAPTFTAWARDPDTALAVANTVTATLTSRTSPPMPAGYTLGPYDLDLEGDLLTVPDGTSGNFLYGVPVRVRVFIEETA